MARRLFVAATLGFGSFALAAVASLPAGARPLPPLVPIALVEDVKSATAEVEFMDYVGSGQVIALAPKDTLVLSYLRSCQHEVITGGNVKVGLERSEVEGGQVVRSRVPCDDGKVQLTGAQASQSGASAFRLQSADAPQGERPATLYARAPVFQLPAVVADGSRTLRIERTDRHAKPIDIRLDESVAAGAFYDLGKTETRLARGAAYKASLGGRSVAFRIDRKASFGPMPAISRLVRFP